MTRVQIPAYTDRWMRGDMYGELVKVTKDKGPRKVHGEWVKGTEIAHVKLDKSGKVRKFILADCTEV